MADEHFARRSAIDAVVPDLSAGDDRQSVERYPLGGHRRAAAFVPARLAVGPLDEMAADPLGPFGLHARRDATPQPVRLDQLGRHHPPRWRLGERRAGHDRELRAVSTAELTALPIAHPEMREQAGEQRLMHEIGMPCLGSGPDAEATGHLPELAEEVLPLTHPEVVEKFGPAQFAELARRHRLLALTEVIPQLHEGEEVRTVDDEPAMRFVSGLARRSRSLARVLDRQRSGDDHHLAHAATVLRLEYHPRETRIDRESGHPASESRQPPTVVGQIQLERSEFFQQRNTVADGATVGWIEERERGNVTESERRHLQDDRGEVRAQDLGLDELRPVVVVRLGVQTDADTWRDAPAATGALIGRRLRDRLDREPLHLQSVAVARDPRCSGIDHVADSRHRQRGLGDVGRQHDPATGVRLEDAMLLRCRQSRIQREHFDGATLEFAQCVGGVVDLAFAAEEDEDVAGPLGDEFVHRIAHGLDLIAVFVDCDAEGVINRAVAHLDRIRAPRHLDHGGVAKVFGEARGVDRCRRHDQLQIRAPWQQLPQVAEQEIDVEASLVGFVDDQRVVARQHPIVLNLGEQDAVGHHLDQCGVTDAVREADGVANRSAEFGAEFSGNPLGDRTCRESPRLSVPDQAEDASAEFEAQLGQLGALARPGLAGHDHNLIVSNSREQIVAALGNRQ